MSYILEDGEDAKIWIGYELEADRRAEIGNGRFDLGCEPKMMVRAYCEEGVSMNIEEEWYIDNDISPLDKLEGGCIRALRRAG